MQHLWGIGWTKTCRETCTDGEHFTGNSTLGNSDLSDHSIDSNNHMVNQGNWCQVLLDWIRYMGSSTAESQKFATYKIWNSNKRRTITSLQKCDYLRMVTASSMFVYPSNDKKHHADLMDWGVLQFLHLFDTEAASPTVSNSENYRFGLDDPQK